jgi:3-deoxy-D-manno-octulosonic-acid transferase
MIILYKYLGIILIPLIKLNVFFRIIKGKENKVRFSERYGISSSKRPGGDVVWIHAASIGEFKSADLLINLLSKNYTILVTTTTLSAANYASKKYTHKIIHQFAPLDISLWVEKFLNKWRPKLVIWIESDLWPITMELLKQKKIKSLLVNVRMSPQSYKKWKIIKFFYKQMTECFSEIFAQSQLDRERIKTLTSRNIKFIGNLKLSTESNIQQISLDKKLINFQKNRTLMLASTHKNEEFQFLPIIKRLLLQVDGLKIIIAPRHPERSKQIQSIYQKYGISTKLTGDNSYAGGDVLIVDTFGNLPAYFNISDIVFLGGSFVKKGGHNPIEPAINNCVIITGPHVYNWQNIFEDMLKNNACFLFTKISILEKKIKKLFEDNNEINKMKENSKKIAQKNFFDSSELIYIIKNILEVSPC